MMDFVTALHNLQLPESLIAGRAPRGEQAGSEDPEILLQLSVGSFFLFSQARVDYLHGFQSPPYLTICSVKGTLFAQKEIKESLVNSQLWGVMLSSPVPPYQGAFLADCYYISSSAPLKKKVLLRKAQFCKNSYCTCQMLTYPTEVLCVIISKDLTNEHCLMIWLSAKRKERQLLRLWIRNHLSQSSFPALNSRYWLHFYKYDVQQPLEANLIPLDPDSFSPSCPSCHTMKQYSGSLNMLGSHWII